MTHDTEGNAIQGEYRPRTVAPECTDITAGLKSPPHRPAQTHTDFQACRVPPLRRLLVLGAGTAVGAAFALLIAGPVMPESMKFADRFLIWCSLMGGPIVGTAWGMAEFHPSIMLGWLGLLLIPAHPIRPSLATGCVTAVGLFLWFFAGFLAMMVAVWGA